MIGGGDRLRKLLEAGRTPEEAEEHFVQIHAEMLGSSRFLRVPNFEEIAPLDLEKLFQEYDSRYFSGYLEAMLREDRAYPVQFRLSGRMTSAGGKTTRVRPRIKDAAPFYEITISTLLLFQSFVDEKRPVAVVGLRCADRLEALQRIFEHEILHLAEFLAVGTSNCRAPLFQTLASSIFGHKQVVHDLVTPRELAVRQHAIRVGDMVSFDYEGQTRVGRVNRITRRASILVRSEKGLLFSDGQRYETFYVPLTMLRKQG